MKIPLFRPAINRRDMQAVLETMVDDTLGPGQLSEQFILALLDFFDFEGGLAFREIRRLLDVLFQALGLEEGQGILLSPLLPRVYAETARQRGIPFDWVDVDARSGTVGANELETALAVSRDFSVAALFCDTALGFVPQLEVLAEQVPALVLDISKGCGARYDNAIVGAQADFLVLMLEEEDILTTGGGAAVLGRTRKQASGLSRASDAVSREVFLPDLNAALGIAQLKELPQRLHRRREVAEILQRSVMQSRHRLLVQPGEVQSVAYGLPVVVETGRSEVAAFAKKKGVETRPAFEGSIIDAYGAGKEIEESQDAGIVCSFQAVPNAASLWRQTLLFPLYPSLSGKHVQELSRLLVSLP
ncbi:MAG: DegT/DnrJ/EryC1/StrS aminotransferase family protein [Spirochaetaceae bacterium]|nr:MAG: DegT/DnrJ/EryC1/StrS aminotransferase family protein [Spirochaetaceae bacterium]